MSTITPDGYAGAAVHDPDFAPVRSSSREIDWILVLSFMPAGLQWVPVLRVGGNMFEAWFFGMMFLILATLAIPARRRNFIWLIQKFHLLAIAWFAWWLVMTTFAFLDDSGLGHNTLLRQVLFTAFGVSTAAAIMGAKNPGRTLAVTVIVSLATFVGMFIVSGLMIGQSIFAVLGRFFTTGDFGALNHQGLKPIYNSFVASANGEDIASYVASLKNRLSSYLFIISLTAFGISRAETNPTMLLLLRITALIALFGIFIFLTRSVVLVFVLAVIGKVMLSQVRLSGAQWLIVVTGFAALCAGLAMSGAYVEALFDRLFNDTRSFETRLSGYSEGFEVANEHMWFGAGWHLHSSNAVYHNLFVASLAYSGILGLLTALFFYIAMALTWFAGVKEPIRTRVSRLTWGDERWLLGLALLPLVRVHLSGAGGQVDLGGWMAIGIAMGVIVCLLQEKEAALAAEWDWDHAGEPEPA